MNLRAAIEAVSRRSLPSFLIVFAYVGATSRSRDYAAQRLGQSFL
jgi:hypothetical protein